MWITAIAKLPTLQTISKPSSRPNADCNGVTGIGDELADIGDEFMVAEAIAIEAMRGSKGDLKLLRERRAESKAMIEKLRIRVSRTGRTG